MAKSSGRNLLGRLFGFILIAAVVGGVYAGLYTLFYQGAIHGDEWAAEAELKKNQRSSEEYDTAFLNAKPYGPIYARLKVSFPDDYVALKTDLINAERSGSSPSEMKAITRTFIEKFLAAHAADFAAAPADDLKALRIADLDVITTMQNYSKQQCAFYFINGRLPEDLDDVTHEAIANLGALRIDAIAAGRAHPTPRGKVTNADRVALLRAMQRNGLTKVQTQLLSDDEELEAANSADQCAIAVFVSRGLLDLPAATADRLTVDMYTQKPDK